MDSEFSKSLRGLPASALKALSNRYEQLLRAVRAEMSKR